MKRGNVGIGIISTLFISICGGLITQKFITMVWKAQDAAIKANMHALQIAVEEMAVNYCEWHYPMNAGVTVNDIRADINLPQLPSCTEGGVGDKSVAWAPSGAYIPRGVCTFLPRAFRNPVLYYPNLAWHSDNIYVNHDPPANNNWYSVIASENPGCVHYIPWDNTAGGGGATANSVPAYAIVGENSMGGDIGIYLVGGIIGGEK